MTSTERVQVQIDGRVARITIDNPPRNVVGTRVLLQIRDALAHLEGDTRVRAVLLDSANNVPPFAADGEELMRRCAWEDTFKLLQEGQESLTFVEKFPRPVIMAIYDGICMGGALELALSCHMRVAGSGVQFSVPEVLAGALPGWGNTQKLVRMFGRGKATELILTGAPITAAEALRFGAVNHVVPNDQVLPKAREIAESVARMRTKSIEATLKALNVAWELGMAEGKAVELQGFMRIHVPDTLRDGVRALFEQRPIEYQD